MADYELRKLQSKDVFSMLRIINKIGVKEFKDVLESDAVKQAIASTTTPKPASGEPEPKAETDKIGMTVALEIVNVVIMNIPSCEDDIYTFLSSLSGLKKKDVQELEMNVFFSMIMDVFKKQEFASFFGDVSKLVKSGK